MFQLYGDAIHDDTPALQEMIDRGVCEVVLHRGRHSFDFNYGNPYAINKGTIRRIRDED